MGPHTWTAVDDHLERVLVPPDAALAAALDAATVAGLPPHHVSPLQGKLLHLLARAAGARRVLEIGTLAGYSTIWLARAVAPSGVVVTLEIDDGHAAVARANVERAGVTAVVDLRLGPALETLEGLAADGTEPFDLVFIDADKPSSATYLEWAIRLARPGALIVADNVVRGGAVADAASADPGVVGVRRLLDVLGTDGRVESTALQTVGGKGHDGFALALVI